MDPVYISVASAIIALASFAFNFFTYRARLRSEQAHNAARLHEKWWSTDYAEARQTVYTIVEDWRRDGEKSRVFLNYYSSPQSYSERPAELEDFAKLVFFFADLNVYIDKGLIDAKLAHRLFGSSQYAWFKDFIGEVRRRIANREKEAGEHKLIRWVDETKSLERKFSKYKDSALMDTSA